VSKIVDHVRRDRSTVYAALASAGVPGIEHLQILGRLMRSIEVIHAGGRPADAAHIAGYATEKSWRQALGGRLGTSITEIRRRQAAGEEWLLDRWLERHTVPVAHERPTLNSTNDLAAPPQTLEGLRRTVAGRPERRTA
ncbi:MAG: hypothetical protein ACREK1_10285, partial [Longimicrobiales bacterium]